MKQTMKLTKVKELYSTWNIFESEITEDLRQWYRESLQQRIDQDPKMLQFAYDIIDSFEFQKSAYWIDWAIRFIGHTKGSQRNIKYLEKIITDLEKYGILTSTLGTAASRLGDIAPYPNEVLKRTIELDVQPSEDLGPTFTPMLRAAAYGTYIATATNFQTGVEARRSMRASGLLPTVEKAEACIAKWRRDNHEK